MQLRLDRSERRPLYVQVVEQIQDLIRHGALPPGSKLPPIRQLANDLGLTRLTVHNAYAELQADGWIESHVGRGSYVADRGSLPAIQTPSVALPVRENSPVAEVMRMAHQPGVTAFAHAAPAPETFPVREFSRSLHHVLADAALASFDYGITQGDADLREQLAQYMLDRSVTTRPEQIVVTGGAQQGIDIALRALVRPGEVVLVEQPSYLGVIERAQLQGLRLVGVPTDEHGIIPEELEASIGLHRPRLLYTIPTFHNPTGICMHPDRQTALLEIASRHQLLILEDDVYGPLAYDGPAPLPLKARDKEGLVIYLTGFSKVLMPGLRLGMITAEPSITESLIIAKRLSDLHSPQLLQCALADYLRRGSFAPHLRMVKALYRERRDAMAAALQRYFPAESWWRVPAGGFCFWVALPPGVRSSDVYADALDHGVAFAPGHVFFPDHLSPGFIRLAFAANPPVQIDQGIALLGELVHAHLQRRVRFQAHSLRESVPIV